MFSLMVSMLRYSSHMNQHYLGADTGPQAAWDMMMAGLLMGVAIFTPLALLLDDNLDFNTEAEIVDVSKQGEKVEVTLRDPDGEMDGTLTLLFSGPEHDLTGWRTLDSAGNLTQVGLHDVKTGKKLNPRLFIVKDFDDE